MMLCLLSSSILKRCVKGAMGVDMPKHRAALLETMCAALLRSSWMAQQVDDPGSKKERGSKSLAR